MILKKLKKVFVKETIKKYRYIIILVVLSLLLYFFKKKPMETENIISPKRDFNEEDAKLGILAVKNKYGVEMAKTVEKMFRHETSHFKSGQYKKTGTPGMTAMNWGSNVPKTPTITFNTNPKLDSANRTQISFIVWNPYDASLFLADYITRHKGNFGRWFSTIPSKQISYAIAVNKIIPRFV